MQIIKSLDLTNFDSENVTDMNSMFEGCKSLKKKSFFFSKKKNNLICKDPRIVEELENNY